MIPRPVWFVASSQVTLGAFSTFLLIECCECSIDMSRMTWLLIMFFCYDVVDGECDDADVAGAADDGANEIHALSRRVFQ